jgi:tetratricopeptide (TPR) repeat protein
MPRLIRKLLRDAAWVLAGLLLFQACGSKRTPSAPDLEIREGWRQYRLGEFNSAVRIFRSVQVSQPRGSEFHLQALYGEASCWNHRRDGRAIAKAVAGYRAVLEEAPQNPLASWCALDIVRTRHLAPADQAIDYGRLVGDYENSLSLPAADPEQSRKILERVTTFLSTYPRTAFASQFYSIIAECYRKMDDQDRRIDYMIKALEAREVDPSNPIDDRSTAYWNIAYAAEFEAGNFALAREYYSRLMNEYPQDIRIFGVRKAFERMDAIEEALREGRNPVTNES